MSCNICIDRLYDLLNHENTHWFQSFVSNHGYVLMSSSKDEDDVKLSAMERSDMSSRYWLYERYRQQRWSTGQRRRGRVLFFSVRVVGECYLTSRYPPISLNNVGLRLETAMCWFVIQTDKLNSSVQACLAGSLHDYVTLLQVHNSFLIFMMGFLISSQAYSLLFCKKKRKSWQELLEMFITMHIR